MGRSPASRAPRRTALAAMLPPRRSTSAAPAKKTAPPRKPMARATRVSLFDREVRVRLAPAALDVLLEAPRLLSEGQLEHDRYIGSTMLSIDLARSTEKISDPADAATARRVAELFPDDERARARAKKIAIREAARAAGAAPLEPPQVDLRVRAAGAVVHLDLDVEARRKS
ncbi:MAG TPA: hypothetical protein VL463_00975 [Kofleriaceae bacterium]|jgi:hypothetical protein|nr:hypothetical protein [Kofleriaceae bacterium]